MLDALENIRAFYSELWRPILSRNTVTTRIESLAGELNEILALPLVTTVSYSAGAYQVHIKEFTPIGVEFPCGRIFHLMFFIHRHYIRIQILTIPPFLRGNGYGCRVWESFYQTWSDLFESFEVEYKTDESKLFWERMGFSRDLAAYTNLDYGGQYYSKKMKYTGRKVFN